MKQHVLVCPYTLDEIEEWKENARKYDELKEAVGKIKEEINQESHYYGMEERFIGVNKAFSIINKHTEGLI